MATSSENMTSTSGDNVNIEATKNLAGSDSQQENTSTNSTGGVDATAVDTSTNSAGGVDATAVDTSTSGTEGVDTTAVLTSTNGTNGDDTIAVLPDKHYAGGSGADKFILHDAGHYKIDDFNASQGDKLDFSKYGLSREELTNRVTNIKIEADNLIVNFGDNVEITLAGVQPGQISWDDIIVDHGGKDDDHGGKGPGGKDDDHGGKGPGGKDDHHGGKGPGGKDDDHGGKGPGGKDDDHGGKGPGGKDDHHGGKGPGGKDDDHGGKGPGGKDDDHGGKGPGGKDDDHGGKGPGGKDDDHGGKGPGGKDDDHGGKGPGGKDDDHGGKGHGGHKHVDARPNEHCQGGEGADNFVFHDLGHWKIDKYNGQEGDMLDFTGYGLTRDEIASHITNIKIEADNFIVNFGDDVSITLVGQPPTWDNVITPEG